jgi:hypothetical protein
MFSFLCCDGLVAGLRVGAHPYLKADKVLFHPANRNGRAKVMGKIVCLSAFERLSCYRFFHH